MIKALLTSIIVFLMPLSVLAIGPQQQLGTMSGEETATCPPFYADTDVLFAIDFNSENEMDGCNPNGTTITGSGSLDPDTTYGDSGYMASDKGVSLDGTNNICWTISGDTHLNDAISTIWVKYELNDDPDNQVTVVEASDGTAANGLTIRKIYDGSVQVVRGYWSSGSVNAGDSPTTENTFDDMGYTWRTDIDDHAMDAEGSGWDEDTEDTMPDLANFTTFCVGENVFDEGAPGAGKDFYVSRIALMSGYQTSVPTNWNNP